MLDPLQILQKAREEVLAEKPYNSAAFWVLCAAIGHVIGTRQSSVDRLIFTAEEK
jgi:hypothetical protein